MTTKAKSVYESHKKEIIIGVTVAGLTCLAVGIGWFLLSDSTNVVINGVKLKSSVSPIHNFKVSRKAAFSTINNADVSGTVNQTIAGIDENDLKEVIQKAVSKRSYASYKEPFPVRGGIVKLSEGRHPSPEKVAFGQSMGMDFEKMRVTWRNNYMKGVA